MTNNLTGEERDKIWYIVGTCITKLHILLDEVGSLDDLFESPLIDSRAPPGAYQYIQRTIDQLEGYMYEVNQNEL